MIYSEIIKSKTNKDIPLFINGHSFHSKYNPENEAINFSKKINGDFIFLFGIGAGFHLREILNKNQDIKIVALEADKESLDFCKNFPIVKELQNDSRIVFYSVENIDQALKEFIPIFYNSLTIIFYPSWENENKELCKKINNSLTMYTKQISSDISVQSHFGKIWQKNIITNLKIINQSTEKFFDTKKIAAIIAAGPSLDKSIEKIKQNIDKYHIISTDTAYPSLIKRNIKVDAVISIDGQKISSTHFLSCKEKIDEGILFVFDLSANPEAVKYVIKKGHKIEFIKNNHPLSNYSLLDYDIKTVEMGSGTVTEAACDWARQNSFKKIELFGADFCYNSGKPYAKGTYLDINFGKNQNRFESLESKFISLEYRTELKKITKKHLINPYTNEIMETYEEGILNWAKKYNFSQKENYLENKNNLIIKKISKPLVDFNFDLFIKNYIKELEKSLEKKEMNSIIFSQIPYIAWLKKSRKYKKELKLEDYIKLAIIDFKRFNKYED